MPDDDRIRGSAAARVHAVDKGPLMPGGRTAALGERPAPRMLVRPRVRGRRFWQSEWFLFLLFVTPNLLLFGVFSYWPMIQNAYLSLVRWNMIAPTKSWVGLANYAYLAGDRTFRLVIQNSLVFTLGAVGGSLVLGLATALLLNQKLRGR